MTILWAIHVQGPDDVYAAPSWAEASEAAAYLEHCMTQSRLREEPDLPAISFVVVPWPHSAESHASEVRRWSEVYPGLSVNQLQRSRLSRLERFRDLILGGMHNGEYVGQSPAELWDISAREEVLDKLVSEGQERGDYKT